jgi:hypothetical protein
MLDASGRPFIIASAVVRVDGPADPADPDSCYNLISVCRVFADQDKAESEAERLNSLNRPKGAYYFATVARVEPKVKEL